MSHRVTLQATGHHFEVADGETVLEAAQHAGIELPYGCRQGSCGACRARLVEGRVDPGSTPALGLPGLTEDHILPCIARPLGDLTLDVLELGGRTPAPRQLPCKVVRMQRLAPDVMALYLKLPAGERLPFRAGQYVDILTREGLRRSFSLANAPHDDALLEFHVRQVPGGAFTGQVFERLREKDLLRIEGPLGSFFLREDSDQPAILLASGTGFAPIKAMVEHAFYCGMTRSMTLYWGGRTGADLYLREMAEAWARRQPNFTFVPVLSEPPPEEAWAGRTGFVHQAVLDDFADLSGHQVYACGAPVMVDAARNSFCTERGLPAGAFFSDAFTLAPPAGGAR